MKYLLIAVLVLSASSVSQKAFAEQKIIFCAESSSYRKGYKSDFGQSKCNDACAEEVDCGRDGLLSEGWKIDTTMQKERIKEFSKKYPFVGDCTCKGTQYVLSMVEKKVEASQEVDKNIDLLKKEIELLKKENELLKQENSSLKSKKKK